MATNPKLSDDWVATNFALAGKCCFVTETVTTKSPIVFVRIFKNASQSIKATWNLTDAQPVFWDDLKKHGYAKVVVIRNPFYRAISGFFHLAKLGHNTSYAETEQAAWHRAFLHGDLKKSFRLFLDYLECRFYDPHILPQYMFLERTGLSLSDIEYVLLHERVDEGFAKLCGLLGLDCRLGRHNLAVPPLPVLLREEISARSAWNYVFRRDLTLKHKLGGVYTMVLGKPPRLTHPLRQWRQTVLKKRSDYAVLRGLVENNPTIRRKIQKIYGRDFDLYEEARARAL